MNDSASAQEGFVVGQTYTRGEVHSRVGGGMQSCLVRAGGAVVAVCFVRAKNPRAPEEIFVGRGPSKEAAARILSGQAGAVPVFEKFGSARWMFIGLYCGKETRTDRSGISEANEASNRSDVVAILPLTVVV